MINTKTVVFLFLILFSAQAHSAENLEDIYKKRTQTLLKEFLPKINLKLEGLKFNYITETTTSRNGSTTISFSSEQRQGCHSGPHGRGIAEVARIKYGKRKVTHTRTKETIEYFGCVPNKLVFKEILTTDDPNYRGMDLDTQVFQAVRPLALSPSGKKIVYLIETPASGYKSFEMVNRRVHQGKQVRLFISGKELFSMRLKSQKILLVERYPYTFKFSTHRHEFQSKRPGSPRLKVTLDPRKGLQYEFLNQARNLSQSQFVDLFTRKVTNSIKEVFGKTVAALLTSLPRSEGLGVAAEKTRFEKEFLETYLRVLSDQEPQAVKDFFVRSKEALDKGLIKFKDLRSD